MKKILLFSICVLGYFISNAQSLPQGFPVVKSSGRAEYGYVQADSANISAIRDTLWTPTYTGTFVYAQHSGGDSAFYVFNGKTTGRKWDKVVMITQSVSGYVLYTDTAAMLSSRVKYSDTSFIVSNRLKISDTSYALSNRLKISDTATAFSYYPRKSLYIGTNYPLRGAGALTGNLTLVADTGRAVSQLVTGGALIVVRDSLQKNIQAAVAGVSSFSMTTANGVSGTVANPTSTPNLTITLGNITPTSVVASGNMTATNVYAGNIVKYSDTASMLATRMKYSDTAFMLSPYLHSQAGVKYYDTSSMLSPYRRTTTKITNSDLANSTISGISLGSNLATLTFDTYLQYISSSYNGSIAATISTNATPNNVGSTLMARDISGNVYANLFIGTLSGNSSSSNTTAITDNNSTKCNILPIMGYK